MDHDAIVLKDVDFVRESRLILDQVNISMGRGEHWAMLGPNGAGKSTILNLCGAITHPTRGSVHVLGHRLGRVDIRELRHFIGHVNPRHQVRSALTAFDVVLTGATGSIELVPRWRPEPETIRRAHDLLEVLGLKDRHGEPWSTMSQGERGRTLIARALLPNPPLLLLDEPSTGLDVAAREQLLETIDHLHRAEPSLSSVLVTHHLEELPSTTTHALLVKDGRIMESGAASEVLNTDSVSRCFSHPIDIEHRRGRWLARTGETTHHMQ